MAEFLLEVYVPHSDGVAVERGAERSRIGAEELTKGTPVRYLRSIFVPENETCFYLCEAASSAEAVRKVARRAGLSFERVTEAVAASSQEET